MRPRTKRRRVSETAARIKSLKRQGRFADTIPLYMEAQALLDSTPLDPAIAYARALVRAERAIVLMDNLARFDEADAAYAEAQAYFDSVRKIDDSVLLDRSLSRMRRAMIRDLQLRFSDADPLYIEAHSILRSAVNPLAPGVAGLRASIAASHAVCLRGLGRVVDAISTLREAELVAVALEDKAERLKILFRTYMNLSACCTDLGHHDEALAWNLRAESLLDGVARAEWIQPDLGKALMSRANSLVSLGRFEEAEAAYASAQEVFDATPSSDFRAQRDRAFVRLNRSTALYGLGMEAETERVLLDAAAILESLPPKLMSVRDHARVTVKLAELAAAKGNHTLAFRRNSRAMADYGSLPDSLPLRLEFVTHLAMWAEQLVGVPQQFRPSGYLIILREALSSTEALTVLPNSGVVGALYHLAWATAGLHRSEGLRSEEVIAILGALCTNALDWLDLHHASPTTLQQKGHAAAKGVDALFDVVLFHLLQAGAFEQIPRLLAERYGRYAEAERERSAASVSGTPSAEEGALLELRREFRSALARLQGLEARLSALGSEVGDWTKQGEALRQDVAARKTALLAALEARRRRSGMESADGAPSGAEQTRIFELLGQRCKAGYGCALVLLCAGAFPERTSATFHTTDAKVARAAFAMIYRAGGSAPTVVILSGEVVRLARALDRGIGMQAVPSTRSAWRGPGSAPTMGADVLEVRSCMERAWNDLQPHLKETPEVFVAVHQYLGNLPWQTGPAEVDVRLFHGLAAALRSLARSDLVAPVAPPSRTRTLGVVSHSPAPLDSAGEPSWNELDARPIPRVFADAALTKHVFPEALWRIDDGEHIDECLKQCTFLQFSCHGSALLANIGPGLKGMTPFALAAKLGDHTLEALLCIACCSASAGTNAFGESGGWSVALEGRVRLVLGSLVPLPDVFCPLFVYVFHSSWASTGDLRRAFSETRQRLKSGEWASSEAEANVLRRCWIEALLGCAGWARECAAALSPDDDKDLLDPEAEVGRLYLARHELYDTSEELRTIVEMTVIFG